MIQNLATQLSKRSSAELTSDTDLRGRWAPRAEKLQSRTNARSQFVQYLFWFPHGGHCKACDHRNIVAATIVTSFDSSTYSFDRATTKRREMFLDSANRKRLKRGGGVQTRFVYSSRENKIKTTGSSAAAVSKILYSTCIGTKFILDF